MNRSELIKTVFKVLIAAGLIYWLIHQGLLDLNVFAKVWSPVFLPICLLIVGINLSAGTLRWYLLLNAGGIEISFFEVLKFSLVGVFFNFAMPGGVGGDVIKGFYVIKAHPGKKTEAGTSIIADRVIGLFSMLLMAMFAMLMNFSIAENNVQLQVLYMGASGIFAVFLCFGLFIFSTRIRNHSLVDRGLKKLPFSHIFIGAYDALQLYVRDKRLLAITIAISFFAQSLVVLFFIVIASATGVNGISVWAYFFAVPIGLIAMALPISPAGIGVGQTAFVYLLTVYSGVSSSLGADALTIFQLCMLLYGLIGAGFYLRHRQTDTSVSMQKGATQHG